LELLISNHEIKNAIKLFADKINSNYRNKEVIIIAILKGSVLFLHDLFEHLDFKNSIEYVDISSYKGKNRNQLISLPFKINVKNQNILIIDDICDTGNTLRFITKLIKKDHPKSIRTSVLLKKKIQILLKLKKILFWMNFYLRFALLQQQLKWLIKVAM